MDVPEEEAEGEEEPGRVTRKRTRGKRRGLRRGIRRELSNKRYVSCCIIEDTSLTCY